jgi:hypothetical protein
LGQETPSAPAKNRGFFSSPIFLKIFKKFFGGLYFYTGGGLFCLSFYKLLGAGEEQCSIGPVPSFSTRLGGGPVGFRHTRLTFSQTPECFTVVVKGTVPKTFLQRSPEKLMSIRTNAKSIGNKDAQSEALAIAIRKAYAKAKPEAQAELAREFKIGYISGREKVSLAVATQIFEAGKGVDAINAGAIDRATSGFNYHIVSKLETKPAPAPVKSMRLSRDVRAAAEAYLAQFESVAEAIKVLRVVAK